MKNQALFSSKDKSKKLKCCLLQFLFGALRVHKHQTSVSHLSTSSATNVKHESYLIQIQSSLDISNTILSKHPLI